MAVVKESETDPKFGWLCSYTPIEIFVAGGLTPVRLDAGDIMLHRPNPDIHQLICPYIRAVYEKAHQEGFGPIEGVVFVKCCDAMFRFYDLWNAHLSQQPAYLLPTPKIQSLEAICYFATAIKRFTEKLGQDRGMKIKQDDLWKAISDVNSLRSSVQRLYQARLKNPQVMPYSKLRILIRKWLSMHPSHASEDVEKELAGLNGKPFEMPLTVARVLLSSSTLDQVEVIRLMEEAGITVVGDDYCSGLRHFDKLVSEEGDPYFNLAERYLTRWPCARMQADPSHIQRLLQEVEAVEANGVIYVGLKYCDQSGYDVPRMQTRFKERQIPMLYIENDYTASGLGQLKVRIEAFSEMLGEELQYETDL